MRVGVLSDVHGNADALDACLVALGDVDEIVFAGDALGYYFDSKRVLDTLRGRCARMLLGNHDLYFLAHLGLREGPRLPAKEAYASKYGPALDRAARELDASDVEFLLGLESSLEWVVDGATRFRMVHGSPVDPVFDYVYPDDPRCDEFGASEEYDCLLMGHTHRPFMHRRRAMLVNPGSVGQPRDGDVRASCARVLVGERVDVQILRVPYDRSRALAQCDALCPDVPLPKELLLREGAR